MSAKKLQKKMLFGVCISLILMFTILPGFAAEEETEPTQPTQTINSTLQGAVEIKLQDGVFYLENCSAKSVHGFRVIITVDDSIVIKKNYLKALKAFDSWEYQFFTPGYLEAKNIEVIVEDAHTWYECICIIVVGLMCLPVLFKMLEFGGR